MALFIFQPVGCGEHSEPHRTKDMHRHQGVPRAVRSSPHVTGYGLVRGRLAGFSTDRLLRCLMSLGQDVEIVVRDKADMLVKAHISVVCFGGFD